MIRIAGRAGFWGALLFSVAAFSCSVRPNSTPAKLSLEGETTPEAKTNPTLIFAQILEKHRISAEKYRSPDQCHSDHPTHTMIEFQFHLTEARLWALSFPGEAERVSFPLALDAASNPDDRGLAIAIVGVLARMGNPRAEPVLCEVLRSDSKRAAESATWVLAEGDPQGRYRELYWQMARRGDFSVLEVLGDWVDPGAKQVLEEIVVRRTGAENYMASRSLRRISWLESPDWADRIVSILGSRQGMAFLDFDWALRAARNRSLPGLSDLLCKRLREVEVEHVEFCKQAWGEVEGREGNPTHERNFTGSFEVAWLDWNFDDILKAYAELGGVLTDLEQKRLYNLGYGTDPQKRLFEFVKEWK